MSSNHDASLIRLFSILKFRYFPVAAIVFSYLMLSIVVVFHYHPIPSHGELDLTALPSQASAHVHDEADCAIASYAFTAFQGRCLSVSQTTAAAVAPFCMSRLHAKAHRQLFLQRFLRGPPSHA
jgi:hypothetical protein